LLERGQPTVTHEAACAPLGQGAKKKKKKTDIERGCREIIRLLGYTAGYGLGMALERRSVEGRGQNIGVGGGLKKIFRPENVTPRGFNIHWRALIYFFPKSAIGKNGKNACIPKGSRS
jgi:hypothetical protein